MAYTGASVSQLELNLLGIPQVFYDGQKVAPPPPKALALLCYLAMQTESVARADLAELLWGDSSKLVNVRMALSEFRDLPEVETWLITEGQQVSVKLATDVKNFEAALHSGNYAEAIKLFQGDTQKPRIFLKGFENLGADDFQNWLELERSRLQQLHLETLQAHLQNLEDNNAFEEALELAHNLLTQDPLNEDAHRAVMRLEHKRGNDEAALAQFEILRLVLKEELEVEPLAETLELLADIEQSSVSKGKQAILAKSPQDIPNLPEKLIGRESLIASIAEILKTQPCLLLQGLGGSGKTALAATLAADYTKHGKVLWLQAGDDAPDILLNAIAQLFDIQHISPAALQQAFAKNKVALVVLDDVWNAYALSKVLETLPMIPVVVTSRQRYPNLKRMDVGRLTRDAAIQLLLHYAGLAPLSKGGRGDSDAATNKLCELLGDHAFALRVAGITLAVDKLEAGELLERIQAAPHALKTPGEFAEEGRESIVSLFNVSVKALSDEAYEALMGLGSLSTSSSTAEFLALCLRRTEDDIENALSELQRRGLAERVARAGNDTISYQLHDLVFSFAKANKILRETTVMRAGQGFLEKHAPHFQVLDIEITNILGTVEIARQEQPALFVAMMRRLVVGDAYYTARGHSPRSFALHKEAVQVAKALNDLEAAHYLLSKLGNSYREAYGDLDKALEAFREALEISQVLNNREREAVLLATIGITLFDQTPSDTDSYLSQAYKIAESEQLHIVISQVLLHQGFVAGHRQNWEETKRLSEESIHIAHVLKTNPSVSIDEINTNFFFSLLNLGEAERMLGNFDVALSARQEAIQLAKEQDKKLWMAYALQEIGEMYHAVNNRSSAQENYHKALELYEQNNAQADYEKLVLFMQETGYTLQNLPIQSVQGGIS